jgi:hypothetical protein
MILDQNHLTSAGLIAAATAVGAFWSQAKGFARYVTGFFSLQKELDNALACQVYKLLRCEYKKLFKSVTEDYEQDRRCWFNLSYFDENRTRFHLNIKGVDRGSASHF